MRRLFSMLLATAIVLALAGNRVLAQTAPYELNFILSLTGGAAFLGLKEQDSLRALEDEVNRTGGIRGRPLKIVVLDDTSNPQISVQLADSLILKKVPVILGPTLTGNCLAVEPLVAENGPVNFCFSPGVYPKPRGYMFANAPSMEDLTIPVLRYLRERNLKRVALVISTDAIGQFFERRFDKMVSEPEFKDFVVVARERFSTTDINIAAQISRIKAANPDALINPTIGPGFQTLLRSMRDGGLDVPTDASAGNMTYAQMAAYAGFLPTELFFGAARGILPEPSTRGAMRKAQDAYFAALKRHNVRPEIATQIPWDVTMLVIDAIRRVGPEVTAPQLRDYLLNVRSFTGSAGTYDFTNGDQRGLGQRGAGIFRWDAAKNDFVLVYPRLR
jgi:branched-chain amino acid transport system substrate-binding protein